MKFTTIGFLLTFATLALAAPFKAVQPQVSTPKGLGHGKRQDKLSSTKDTRSFSISTDDSRPIGRRQDGDNGGFVTNPNGPSGAVAPPVARPGGIYVGPDGPGGVYDGGDGGRNGGGNRGGNGGDSGGDSGGN